MEPSSPPSPGVGFAVPMWPTGRLCRSSDLLVGLLLWAPGCAVNRSTWWFPIACWLQTALVIAVGNLYRHAEQLRAQWQHLGKRGLPQHPELLRAVEQHQLPQVLPLSTQLF